jgi:hypothetical protein
MQINQGCTERGCVHSETGMGHEDELVEAAMDIEKSVHARLEALEALIGCGSLAPHLAGPLISLIVDPTLAVRERVCRIFGGLRGFGRCVENKLCKIALERRYPARSRCLALELLGHSGQKAASGTIKMLITLAFKAQEMSSVQRAAFKTLVDLESAGQPHCAGMIVEALALKSCPSRRALREAMERSLVRVQTGRCVNAMNVLRGILEPKAVPGRARHGRRRSFPRRRRANPKQLLLWS